MIHWVLWMTIFASGASGAEEGITAKSPVRVIDEIDIRFMALSPRLGLSISLIAFGDEDGETTFANIACCGVGSAQKFVRDVRIEGDGQALKLTHSDAGWTVRHAPSARLRIDYRLPPTGPMTVDAGVPEQLRPIVRPDLFHVVGTFDLLLPTGRRQADLVQVRIDATRVAGNDHFVSSFGGGSPLTARVARSQITKSLYLGGAIALAMHETPEGRVAIASSGMNSGFAAGQFSEDALAILAAVRKFFGDSQPWYLISIHGGERENAAINIGGGMGLTNSFVTFASSDLDADLQQHREQFRWGLAHEYFHHWNGLGLRLAAQPGAKRDDIATYWFSEGVTEFYTMRILTRIGLQTSERSVRILD